MATKPLHPTRVCRKCAIEKPHTRDHFVPQLGKLTSLCRECNKADCARRYQEKRAERLLKMRQYREENREAVLAAQRRYYREHVEERKVYDRAYREANRDRRNKWHREWSQRNPERIAFYNSRYQKSEVGRENGRKRTREWRRRNLDRVREDRRAAYQSDPERHREYTRRWREANIEHANALARAWYRENKAKVKAWDHARRVATNTGEFFTAEDIEIIYSEQDGHCTYCRTDLSSGYEADHFIPIARGGGNEPENIVLACMPCNRSKGAKMPWEWRPDEFRTPPRP